MEVARRAGPHPVQRPPAAGRHGRQGHPGPAAPAASTAVERLQAQERDKQTRESEAKLKAEEARNKQIRADNCKSAREQMASLRSGMRVARINDKGEREVLDDAQRNAQIQRTQEAINSNCN